MKWLLKISWGIAKDNKNEHEFNVESIVFKITGQEIAIKSQKVISCIEFLMRHPSFE